MGLSEPPSEALCSLDEAAPEIREAIFPNPAGSGHQGRLFLGGDLSPDNPGDADELPELPAKFAGLAEITRLFDDAVSGLHQLALSLSRTRYWRLFGAILGFGRGTHQRTIQRAISRIDLISRTMAEYRRALRDAAAESDHLKKRLSETYARLADSEAALSAAERKAAQQADRAGQEAAELADLRGKLDQSRATAARQEASLRRREAALELARGELMSLKTELGYVRAELAGSETGEVASGRDAALALTELSSLRGEILVHYEGVAAAALDSEVECSLETLQASIAGQAEALASAQAKTAEYRSEAAALLSALAAAGAMLTAADRRVAARPGAGPAGPKNGRALPAPKPNKKEIIGFARENKLARRV